jgi:hypothetical protein
LKSWQKKSGAEAQLISSERSAVQPALDIVVVAHEAKIKVCNVRLPFATVGIVSSSNCHTTSVLYLRSPNSTGHLFLLFFFQFSFFLWIKLGLFLFFPFAFIFSSLISHICFSLLENDLRRTVAAKPRFRS